MASTKALGKRKQAEEELQNGESSSEGEEFPEIDLGGSDESDPEDDEDEESGEEEDDDEEQEDLTEEQLMQRERAEEEQLERELREEEEADESSEIDSNASLTDLIERYRTKPDESQQDDVLTPGTSVPDEMDKSQLLGFDTRQFQNKRRTVKSNITGEDKYEWDPIEPGYDSDSAGEDVCCTVHIFDELTLTDRLPFEQNENRVGNVPSYFYEDMPHVGYDIEGKRVMKPATADELDKFLSTVDGSSWCVLTFGHTSISRTIGLI